MSRPRFPLVLPLFALLAACSSVPPAPDAPPTVLTAQRGPTGFVSATIPASGATGVSPTTPPRVTFDRDVHRESVETAAAFFKGTYDPARNPATFAKLGLTSMCDGRWLVRNPNAAPISFSWDAFSTDERGVGVVEASSTTLFTSTRGRTVRLFVSGVQHSVKASNPAACTVRDVTTTWSEDGRTATFTPAEALQDHTSYTLVLSTLARAGDGTTLTTPLAVTFTTGTTRPEPASRATGTVGASGGAVVLGSAEVTVPAGVFDTDVTVTLERLDTSTPSLPGPYEIVGVYRLTVTTGRFNGEIEVTLPVTLPSHAPDPFSELYVLDQDTLVKDQIGGEASAFTTFAAPLRPEDGRTPSSFERTYVVARTTVSALRAGYETSGGTFNGSYGECPEGTESHFGTCRKFPPEPGTAIGPTMRTQAYTSTTGVRFMSLNAGNSSLYCMTHTYNVKLCSFAVEERVRNLVNRVRPDLVVAQEFFNDRCTGVDTKRDRVCGPDQKITAQHQRILDPGKYDTRCDDRPRAGYECISVRRGTFAFTDASAAVQAFRNPDCPTDAKRGEDTGFFAASVRLLDPQGSDSSSFDVINAHLATPAPRLRLEPTPGVETNAACRAAQIRAVSDTWRNARRKVLIAGDFNTGVEATAQPDTQALNAMGARFGSPINAFPAVRLAYFVSDPSELTAYSVEAAPAKLDHVLSNFVDVRNGDRCRRGEEVPGLDHRRTECTLFGFDSGRVRTSLLVSDTTGQVPDEFVSSLVTVSRKGARLPFVRVTGTVLKDIILPDEIGANIALDMNCPHALPVYVSATVSRGSVISLGTQRLSVYRPFCP